MKKSINITLNGLIFSLEEDAYEKLNAYLESIKNFYKGPEEEKEILADIEASIAEKFNERLKGIKQVVTISDVEEIIKVMGTVEEIANEPSDAENKEGGKNEMSSKKRLYRNTDDVVIAGVCSGLAAYFGIDPVFIRILFVILILADGIGILAYLIFWIAMPKAVTSAQKLEMRGKPVNLQEIEQAVKEKSRMIGEEGKEALSRLQGGNIFRKILNVPVKLIEVAFNFIKRVISIIFPILGIFFGGLIIAGSIFGIIGLSILSLFMIFNINSPYIISDLPLQDLASQPTYYLAVVSLYLASVLPMIFFSALGITLIRRKNSFNLIASSILIGIWMLSIISLAVATADLIPMVKAKIEAVNKQEIISKNFDYKDFNKLYIGGNQKLIISKGDEYSISLSGRKSDMDRLEFETEMGQLRITQKPKESKGLCIFCFNREIIGEITVPDLESYVGIGRSNVELKGFEKDLYISLGEEARANIELKDINLKGSISGVNGRLKLTGKAKNIDLKMDGFSHVDTDELNAEKISLEMKTNSRAELNGESKELDAEIKAFASLEASNLKTQIIVIDASGNSRAEVYSNNKLDLKSSDLAVINYLGSPKELLKKEYGNSTIQRSGSEFYQDDNKALNIKIDAREYSPIMSSIRGIGLLPEYEPNNEKLFYIWKTNQGAFVENWDKPAYVNEIKINDKNKKIYWTFNPGEHELNESEPVYIYLEIKSEENNLMDSARIEFKYNKGFVTYQENE